MVSAEEVVDDDGGKVEEHAGDLVGMRVGVLPHHDAVEDVARVGESAGLHGLGRDGPGVWSVCLAQVGMEQALEFTSIEFRVRLGFPTLNDPSAER